MEIEIPLEAYEIVSAFKKAKFEIYIVGGAVRDVLMAKPVYDWDFTTNASPEDMLGLVPNSYYTNKFGTVGVPSKKESDRPYEITTFRTEGTYSDARRPDRVSWGKSLAEDLKRRDFTINAFALEIITAKNVKDKKSSPNFTNCHAKLIDLYDGQSDIKNKLIRAVGNPGERFSEDALRMMRAVRISAELNFSIEETTLEAIQKYAANIKKISAERVRDELLKILASQNAFGGITALKTTGLMHFIMPELEENFGVEQASPGRHHIYDVGTHSLLALKFVSEKNSDPIVRLATLIHDIGKAKTAKKLASGTITFYNHEVVGGRTANEIAKRLRLNNNDKDRLWKLVRYHQFTLDEHQTDSAIRRFIRNVGSENINDVLDLRVGDRLGGGARETSWRLEEFKKRIVEVQKQPFAITDLKISGFDVMKILAIKPGPKVGQTLNALYNDVIAKKVDNKKGALTKRLLEKTKIKSD